MGSPVLLGSVLRSQSRAEQAYSWGDHALAGYLLNVVEDTTPQLGGDLDANGFDIIDVGNIGIGTSSPAVALHVSAGAATMPTLGAADLVVVQGAVGANAYINVVADAAYKAGIRFSDTVLARGQIAYDHSNDSMTFNTSAGERVRIDSTGKVGIGNTSPSVQLTVDADASSADTPVMELNALTTYGGRIVLNSNQCANEWQINWGTGSTDRFQVTQLGSGGAEFEITPMSGGAGGTITLGTAQVFIKGVMGIKEQAAAPSAAAAYGYLWVKNTTPCELWFTDDAGTSTKIA